MTTVNQTTGKAAINWWSFSTQPNETVNFIQPNSSAITLNRVVGNEQSVLAGALNATGRVFLINSNGVLFTRGSSVNTGGLLASSLGLSDADFNASNYVFKANGAAGSVTNLGTLIARDGGYVALLGQAVSNQGVIVATKGTVALASGDRIALNFSGDSLLGVTIDQGSLDALVENKGAIYADGGSVILTAKAAGDLLSAQVNNSGVIEARSVADLKGRIALHAIDGTTHVNGVLDASAPLSGDGGFIETSGDHVKVAEGASVTTWSAKGKMGTWLLDPDGFTIAASGGDMTGSLLGSLLGRNNITLESTMGGGADGNLNVNDAVSWSANTLLTLNATNNININAAISASGASAGLALNYGGFAANGSATPGTDYHINNLTTNADGSLNMGPASVTLSGANASLSINGQAYQLIHSMADLAAISPGVVDPVTGMYTPAAGFYALAQDLSAAGTTYTSTVVGALSGTLAGLGHKISNLSIVATVADPTFNQFPDVALIDAIDPTLSPSGTGVVRDIGLVNVNMISTNYSQPGVTVNTLGGGVAAGLAASNNGSISNTYVTGTISGRDPVGGLVGWNVGTINNAHVDVAILALAAGSDVGGMAGMNYGTITHSTAKGTIDAAGIDLGDGGGLVMSTNIGGLVGTNYGTIDYCQSYVAVTVTNSWSVGGLVGLNYGTGDSTSGVGIIKHSTASGPLTVNWTNIGLNGQSYGGLVGDNNGGFISDSSASVNVKVTATTTFDTSGDMMPVDYVGGLVGSNEQALSGGGGSISNSSASGSVTGIGTVYEVGGAVGFNFDGTLSRIRATGNVTGGPTSSYVGGLVGQNVIGVIADSSASGKATGGTDVGGLVGLNSGAISNSSATGAAEGIQYVGGLVGTNSGSISGSTASGNATGTDYVGGLVGNNLSFDPSNPLPTISGSSATGSVTCAGSHCGGLTGFNDGTITNSTYTDVAAEAAAAAAAQAAADAAAAAAAQAAADAAAAAKAAAQAASAAARLQARVQGAGQHSNSLIQALVNPAGAGQPKPFLAEPLPSVDSAITFSDTPDFAADIKSITVDGVRFDLDDPPAANSTVKRGDAPGK